MNFEDHIKNKPYSWAIGITVSCFTLVFGFMKYINYSNNEGLKNQIDHLSRIEREKDEIINKLNVDNKVLRDDIENNKIALDEMNRKYSLLENNYEKLMTEKNHVIKNLPSKNGTILTRIKELESQKKECTIWVYPSDVTEQEQIDSCTQYNLNIDKRIDDFYKLLQ